jgi:hypothetical protein
MKPTSSQQSPPIAVRLESLAKRIRQQTPPQSGHAFAAAIRKLSLAVDRFEALLDELAAGRPSVAAELEQFFAAPNVRATLDVTDLKTIAKTAAGLRLQSSTPAKAREELVRAATTGALAKKILSEARQRVASKAPVPAPTDTRGLRAEFLRIGGLDEAAAAQEFRTTYRTLASVRALARANAIRRAERADREALWNDILAQARRLRANIRHIHEQK